MKKWLVTAFEPFGGSQTNASQVVLRELARRDWNGRVDFFEALPVAFHEAWPALEKRLALAHYDGVLSLGESAKRDKLNPERVGLNWMESKGPDNRGLTPTPQALHPGQPLALWSSIPWERLPKSPLWEMSFSAGTYVCNALLYDLLRWSEREGRLAGFVHVPTHDPLRLSPKGLEEILQFLVEL